MNLSSALLKRALKATLHHGYGTLFAEPPELGIVKSNWTALVVELSKIDLDTYPGYDAILSFAPKSRLNVRRVGLLHPYDFIFYTALVLALKPLISKSRLPVDKVFSYRTEGTTPNELYQRASSWKDFRNTVELRSVNADCIVGVTDIADFYPRIYHHRLMNALEASADKTTKEYIRVLGKMLTRFSGGTSYGIPVGPPASRLLGEAVLIDVDSTLLSFGIDFIRFVDDYIIFADRVQDAEYGIRVLGETLFRNHGLTLQTAKTKISSAADYVGRNLLIHSDKESNRRRLLQIFGDGDYQIPSYDELDDDQKKEIDAFNLSEMLREALLEGENVDYREVQFILGRLAALRKPELIPTVLENLERLYPVAESVAAFFKEFTDLPNEEAFKIGQALLNPILNALDARPSEYYSMWILSVFQHHKNWDHAEDLLRIFRETSSDAVRRFAALALAKSGTRTQALAVKDYLASASPLCRTAMLLATAKLGKDERQYFGKSLQLSDSLEKLCIKATI
jgi:uncharacterized protein (DUF433 family)